MNIYRKDQRTLSMPAYTGNSNIVILPSLKYFSLLPLYTHFYRHYWFILILFLIYMFTFIIKVIITAKLLEKYNIRIKSINMMKDC